jgi:hypothetical protein
MITSNEYGKQHYTGTNDCKYLVWQIALNLDQWILVSSTENSITHMHTQKMSANNLKFKRNILLQTGWLVHACSHFWECCILDLKKCASPFWEELSNTRISKRGENSSLSVSIVSPNVLRLLRWTVPFWNSVQ